MSDEQDKQQIPPKACKFCCFAAGGGKARVCRYNPPRATGFPRVRHDDWCSKYKPNNVLIDAEIDRKAQAAQKALDIQKRLNPK